jgi:3-oxoacyl-[acyl-carrier-protein] synthase-1
MEEKMADELMRPSVYAIATNITSALGSDPDAHWAAVETGKTGVEQHEDEAYSAGPFWASRISAEQWDVIRKDVPANGLLSSFEQLALFSARMALKQYKGTLDPHKTLLILSTTKGNIEWLNQTDDEQLLLHRSAAIIAGELGLTVKPVVVSHACVSGVIALQYALRHLQAGHYESAIVLGCDRFTKFVLSGFQSFQAIADGPCRPFDADRTGINLGEAAATIVLSTREVSDPLAVLLGGATSNDANHISGPSRSGEELGMAIRRSLDEAGLDAGQLSMISAHGTATMYNDEMESKAFGMLGLGETPVHSFKGYIGHTLGAAGVVESAMIIEALQRQQLIPSPGFEKTGTSVPLNVSTAAVPSALNYVLKTASGFGGCNAAAVWGRVER